MEIADSHLLAPVRVRGIEIRNRVVMTAHGASDVFRNPLAPPTSYVDYLRARAAGGVGLIISQPIFFAPGHSQPQSTVDRHGELAAAVRGEGAALVMQLAHLGAAFRSDSDARRPPLWGFSGLQTAEGEASHRMTAEEIGLMVEALAGAAAVARQSGFDGVEVHGGHGYLIQQSLSPWLNTRDDAWGQDRTLFVRQVIAAVREAVGHDLFIGYRTVTDDLRSPEDGGLGVTGLAETLRAVLGTGEVDLINTTVGSGGASYAQAIPDYRSAEAPNIGRVRRIRDLVHPDVPMIGVGRIASLAVAEAVLAAGDCDLVAMTRATIADPDVVNKYRAGLSHRVRPCVGANLCVNRKLAGWAEISCFHNPTVLREAELAVRPTPARRHVVVVGAGPAGLKTAETAARAGHRVTVLESSTRTGGALRLAEHTAAAALAASLDHLTDELAERGVEVRLGTAADEALLRALAPDVVVLATGASSPGPDVLPGGSSGHVVTSAQALVEDIDDEVLLYDGVGANEGALVAEALARRGKRVTFVTRFEVVMPYGGALHRVQVPGILRQRMSAVHTETIVGEVDGHAVTLVRAEGSHVADVKAGSVVAVVPPLPDLRLVPVLERLGVRHLLAGDVVAPRTAWHAFKDGAETGLRL